MPYYGDRVVVVIGLRATCADVSVHEGTGAKPHLFNASAIRRAASKDVFASREEAEAAIWAAHLATACDCKIAIAWV